MPREELHERSKQMANHKSTSGPDRLGGAQPPSSGGYGDIDRSPQRVGESDAPDVKQQEPRALEGLSGMNPQAALGPDRGQEQPDPPASAPPPGVDPDTAEIDPAAVADRDEGSEDGDDALDG
jgi:hypothetical protein